MSNDREDLEARIAAYIDGELPAAEAARLEVFLANTDPKLAEQVIGMIGDRHQLRALPHARAPEDLAARIVEQVERSTLLNNVEHFNTHPRAWWQSRAALAAAVFLVLGGFTYFILQALHPANPAWQAAVDTAPHSPPTVAAVPAPEAPLMAAARSAKTADQAGTPPDAIADNTPPPAMVPAGAAETLPASALAAALNDQPVLLTLAAQTPDDIARLHAELESLLSKDVAATGSRDGAPEFRLSKADARSQNAATPLRQDNTLQQSQMNANSNAAPTPAQSQNLAAQPPSTADQPLVYHLTLRPAQLAHLTQQFQVQSLTRDNQPYTLPAPPTTQPVAAEGQVNNIRGDVATTSPAASADTPIDCVITIVPPTPATAPAAQ